MKLKLFREDCELCAATGLFPPYLPNTSLRVKCPRCGGAGSTYPNPIKHLVKKLLKRFKL